MAIFSTHPYVGIWTLLVRVLTGLFVAWLLILGVALTFRARLILLPNYPDRIAGDWNPIGLHPQDVWLQTSDGIKLHSWWIPNSEAKFTFLAFHGNAGNIAARASVYEFLRQLPANVLAVEFRGYGKSEGTPSEEGLYRDAEAAYQYLVATKGIAPETIISYGQSLGSAVATHLAADKKVGGLALEAPFPSLSEVARKKFWYLPGLDLAARSLFDTEQRLSRITAPILIVHCTQDPVVPPESGEKVYQQAQSPKFILRIEADCHEEASLIAPRKYRAALQDFLNEVDRGPGRQ
jgi:uncharacterized protein